MRKRNTYPAFLADETAENIVIGITGENSLIVDCASVRTKSVTGVIEAKHSRMNQK